MHNSHVEHILQPAGRAVQTDAVTRF